MDNFVLIAVCILAGMALQRTKLVPPDAHKGINTWIIYLALPAVSFKYLPYISWTPEMLFPVLSMVLVWAGSWLFMELYCRHKGYGQKSQSTLELSAGYSNTSFIGFPLIIAYFGEDQLSIAIICDQTVFTLLAIAGIIAAVKGSRKAGSSVSAGFILRRLFTFPPFIGCMLALTLPHIIDISPADPLFDSLAATVAPLALFTIGLQLKFDGWRKQLSQISVAMLYKLMIAPALVLILVLVTGIRGDIARISIFEAAMPTLLTSGIVAEQYGLNARLINIIIGANIAVCFLTTAFWDFAIRLLAI